MAQGRPPRHSRQKNTAPTIDLEASPGDEKKDDATKADEKDTAKSETATGRDTSQDGKVEASGTGDTKPGDTAKTETVKTDTPKPDSSDAGKAESPKSANVADQASMSAAAKAGSETGKTDAAMPATGSGPVKSGATGPAIAKSKDDPDTSKTAKAEAEKPRKTSDPAANTPPPSRSSGGSSLAGGLIGGVIALVAAGGLVWSGVVPLPSGNQTASVSESDLNAVKGELSDLRAQMAEAGSASSETDGAALSALAERVSSLEDAPAASGSGDGTDLAPLEAQLSDLASRVDSLSAGSGAGSDASEAIDQLNGEMSALTSRVSGEAQERTAALSDISERIGGLEQSIGALSDRVGELEAAAEAPRDDIRVARAIAASGLKAAIDRGGPFMAELEAFASVAGDDPAIADLRELAATGVPSRGALLSEFSEIANRMIAAAQGDDPDQGVLSRLMSSATSVIKVRPTGEIPGDSVEAIVARMETRLLNGDLTGAQAEWETLPDSAKAVSEGFIADLKARIRAEQIIGESIAGAMSATGGNG